MSMSAAALTVTTVFSLLHHLLPVANALGSASTLAISDATGAVCGISAGPSPRSVLCVLPGSALPSPALPNASFDSLSGGRDFLCGLRSGGRSLFCWSPSPSTLSRKRLYGGPVPLSDLSVGSDQVAAIDNNGSSVQFWRGNGGGFPQFVSGEFRSLTSGNGFTCGIDVNGTVRCWGRTGSYVERTFADVLMSNIVAGDSQVCGFRTDGVLICTVVEGSDRRLDVPFGLELELFGLAVGADQSCAIRQRNGTVICWRGSGKSLTTYTPANDTSFILLVAGKNLTCGLTSANYSVVCWGPDPSNPSPAVFPLPKVLPGFCRADKSSCQCGVFPDSESLCSVSGVICSPCSSKARVFGPPEKRKTSRLWVVYAIVGSVGCLSGICAILYCLWTGVCRQKRVHNSVQPTVSAAARNSGSNDSSSRPQGGERGDGVIITSPPQPIPRTMSRIFRRQGSNPMRRQRSGTSKGNLPSFKAESFSFSDLAEATRNFSPENKIGSGSFGTVYKGKLPDGREVAIKRSDQPGTRRKKLQEAAFQSELAFLSRLHHKHLVGLVGFCDEEEERLLVYEYMKNGSLYDHLHGGGAAGGGRVLRSWRMRIKVLLDAARGVEYLHNYAVPPIIHRDIKSSNILLDGRWEGKVSDFGLSLAGAEAAGGGRGGEEVAVMTRAAGTVGYMDPEYYGLQQLTTKSDVYGLGVVMLEVLTGRTAIYKEEGGGVPRSVVDYAVPGIVAGDLGRVVDPAVGAPPPREAEAVELVAYTAVRCVSLEGRERPFMSDVVDNLESALALCEEDPDSFSSGSIRSVE